MKITSKQRQTGLINVTGSTNLSIRPSSVNTVDDVNVNVGESFSKSEKLEETEQKMTEISQNE